MKRCFYIEKIISPEFFTGKLFCLLRAFFGIPISLITKPSRQSMLLALLILRVTPKYTMLTASRLANLYNLVNQINKLGIEGDIVECGVWNGGSAAVMGFANGMAKNIISEKRDVWLFDSFEGLPKSAKKDAAIEEEKKWQGFYKGSVENVKKIFRVLSIRLQNVHILKGWFEETLAAAPVKKIALLHIDVDLHDSVKVCLNNLYDRVTLGGFIVCDDYSWEEGRQAIDDFIKERNIEHVHLTKVEGAIYFQKPKIFYKR